MPLYLDGSEAGAPAPSSSIDAIAAGDMSGDLNSSLIDLGSSPCRVSAHVLAPSNTHVGTVYFRQTNDSGETPIAMAIPTVPVTSGNPVSAFVEIPDPCGRFLEIFYDDTTGGAGAGSLDVIIHIKS